MDLSSIRDVPGQKGPKEEILKFRPISADSHVTEPPNMYRDYIDPKFRDRAPHVVRGDAGDVFILEGLDVRLSLGALASAGRDPKDMVVKYNQVEDIYPGAWDPIARLDAQDEDGVVAEVIFPSIGMVVCQMPDPELQHASMWAYNRWMSEFCAAAPKRLFAAGQTNCHTPAQTIADILELKKMGFKGVAMMGFPWTDADFDQPDWDPVWATCVELKMPICFHVFASRKPGSGGDDGFGSGRGPKIGGWHRVIRDNQDIIGMFIFGGVFDRFPDLKVVCVEADAGWAPHFAYRMDHMYLRHRYWQKAPPLKRLPSDYFHENIWMTFQDDYIALQTIHLMNPKRLMWGNDFPHPDSTWPWSHALLTGQMASLNDEQRQLVLHQNVKDLFQLDV